VWKCHSRSRYWFSGWIWGLALVRCSERNEYPQINCCVFISTCWQCRTTSWSCSYNSLNPGRVQRRQRMAPSRAWPVAWYYQWSLAQILKGINSYISRLTPTVKPFRSWKALWGPSSSMRSFTWVTNVECLDVWGNTRKYGSRVEISYHGIMNKGDLLEKLLIQLKGRTAETFAEKSWTE